MKIYTKSGDKGKTSVYGGSREFKDSARIEVLGELDEFTSTVGLLRTKLSEEHEWQKRLEQLQIDMMDMMSHLSRPSSDQSSRENKNPKPINGAIVCEEWIDEMERKIKSPSDYFLLPGGNEVSALCHVCRTQVRRAERRLITLMREDPDSVEEYITQYVNRLSDLFFTMARYEMDKQGLIEEKWNLFIYKKF